jgi:hypothetical protein
MNAFDTGAALRSSISAVVEDENIETLLHQPQHAAHMSAKVLGIAVEHENGGLWFSERLKKPAVQDDAVRSFERDVLGVKEPRDRIVVHLLARIKKEGAAPWEKQDERCKRKSNDIFSERAQGMMPKWCTWEEVRRDIIVGPEQPKRSRYCETIALSPAELKVSVTPTSALKAQQAVERDFKCRAGHGDLCALEDFGPDFSDHAYLGAGGNDLAAAALHEKRVFRRFELIFETEVIQQNIESGMHF